MNEKNIDSKLITPQLTLHFHETQNLVDFLKACSFPF